VPGSALLTAALIGGDGEVLAETIASRHVARPWGSEVWGWANRWTTPR
jgi:hypothetical protein